VPCGTRRLAPKTALGINERLNGLQRYIFNSIPFAPSGWIDPGHLYIYYWLRNLLRAGAPYQPHPSSLITPYLLSIHSRLTPRPPEGRETNSKTQRKSNANTIGKRATVDSTRRKDCTRCSENDDCIKSKLARELVVSLTLAIDYGDSAQTGSSYLEP
jgi:hypothetical protein